MLFLAAGAVLHAIADQQDLRRFGGLIGVLPLTYVALLIGSMSLIALPYLTGWWSKDCILEMAAGTYNLSGTVVYGFGSLVAGITAFYSTRLFILTFFGNAIASAKDYSGAHESSLYVVVPLVVLGLGSIILGYVSSDIFRGIGTDFLSTSVSPWANSNVSVDSEFGVTTFMKLLPFMLTLLGTVSAYWLYNNDNGRVSLVSNTSNNIMKHIFKFMNYQWHWNALINGLLIVPGLKLGYTISKVLDRGLFEAIGPYGLNRVVVGTGQRMASYDTGIVSDYALYIVLAALSLIVITIVALVTDLNTTIKGFTLSLLFVNMTALFIIPRNLQFTAL